MKAWWPTGNQPATSWTAAERSVVGHARLRVCLLVALAVTALVTLVGGVAFATLVKGQERQIHRELRYSAIYGDPTGPPGCTWLFMLSTDQLTTGPIPPPPGFPLRNVMDTVADTGTASTMTVERNDTVYFVLTSPRGGGVVQAVFDARYQLADRRHLLFALAVAEAIGLLAAAATGLVVGRFAVSPLAEALARQRRFIADASHELRTPITQVHTRAQVLARRARHAGFPAEHRAELDRLIGTTRRLGEVVDDLLLSVRLSATSAAGSSNDPVDIAGLAETAVTAESDRASELGVILTLHRPDEPVRVPGVASALQRVLSELLANALRHTPAGGRIDVSVRRMGDGELVELTVADTGTGFDPTERVFDRFHRGAGPGTRRTGLGLALVREVVTGHGGTIGATGRPGHGATFTVRLPAARRPAVPVSGTGPTPGTRP